jgi:hypothetical protein
LRFVKRGWYAEITWPEKQSSKSQETADFDTPQHLLNVIFLMVVSPKMCPFFPEELLISPKM